MVQGISYRVVVAAVVSVAGLVSVGAGAEGGGKVEGKQGATTRQVKRVEDGSARTLLNEVLAAHGGLARYRTFGGMTYRTVGFPLTPHVAKASVSTVDLVSRNNRIESEDFTIGFDGRTGWSVPGPAAVGLPARFFSLGSFYFVGMPFVFADGGVVLTDKGTQQYRGKTYRVINASYDDGTGFSAQDDYDLFVDPASKQLGLINHSVTEIGVARVTWEFPQWQRVDGLLVPAKLVYFGGFDANPKGDGAAATVSEVKFSAARPAAATYAAPAGATIETK